jgi:hypothetical protein
LVIQFDLGLAYQSMPLWSSVTPLPVTKTRLRAHVSNTCSIEARLSGDPNAISIRSAPSARVATMCRATWSRGPYSGWL